MWSSERPRRSRRTFLLGGCLTLGACNIRPLLLETADDQEVRQELEAISIVGLDGRLGQLVRTSLLDQLNPAGADVPNRYILQVHLQRSAQSLGIQLNDEITRFNLVLTARFELLDAKGGRVLYEDQVRRIASYNVAEQPYATLAAEVDAERRVANEVGNNIRTVLAVYFANQTAVT
jgi:LPS-assembly lipoprotein